MKNKLLLLVIMLAFFVTIGCQQKTVVESVNIPESTKQVNRTMDDFHLNVKTKNVDKMSGLITDDATLYGTDKTEMWGKERYIAYMKESVTSQKIKSDDYGIDKRSVIIADNGKSAVVLEQYKLDALTPNIPWRSVSYLVNVDSQWKIKMISYNLLIDNDDVPELLEIVK